MWWGRLSARPARSWLGVFSSEADTGSRQENVSKPESGAPFRFYRNGNGFGPRLAARLSLIAVLAALTAGCFHPMYAEHTDGSPALRDKLMGVELLPIDKPNASRDARIGVEIRNALAFKLYGGATGAPPTHQLRIRFSTTRSSLMLDPNTALPSNESYGIDASYQLIEVATGKTVLNANTFARTSYDIPGQFQRFARSRAYRDAEDRAAQQIADNINTRLASFFYSGM